MLHAPLHLVLREHLLLSYSENSTIAQLSTQEIGKPLQLLTSWSHHQFQLSLNSLRNTLSQFLVTEDKPSSFSETRKTQTKISLRHSLKLPTSSREKSSLLCPVLKKVSNKDSLNSLESKKVNSQQSDSSTQQIT